MSRAEALNIQFHLVVAFIIMLLVTDILPNYSFISPIIETKVSLHPFHINALTHHRYPQTFHHKEE